MKNPGLILLIIFLVLLSLLIISVLTLVSVSIVFTASPNEISEISCSTNIPFGSLYQINNKTPICCTNNILTPNYYIGCDSQYNYVVGTIPTDPHDVCLQYCSSPTGPCTGTSYNGNSAEENYNICMSQLSGSNCIPPMPIAAKGSVLYYAISVTPNSCSASDSSKGCFVNCNTI